MTGVIHDGRDYGRGEFKLVAQTSPDVCVRSTGLISLIRRLSNR